MIDIGFSELLLIGVVALVVIGPEKLPTVARSAGRLMGRLQRFVSTVKADLAREFDAEELVRLRQEIETQSLQFQSHLSGMERKLAALNHEVAGSFADPYARLATEHPDAPFPGDLPIEPEGDAHLQLELALPEPEPMPVSDADGQYQLNLEAPAPSLHESKSA